MKKNTIKRVACIISTTFFLNLFTIQADKIALGSKLPKEEPPVNKEIILQPKKKTEVHPEIIAKAPPVKEEKKEEEKPVVTKVIEEEKIPEKEEK